VELYRGAVTTPFPIDPMASPNPCSTNTAPMHQADSCYAFGTTPPFIRYAWGKVVQAPRNGVLCPYSVGGVVTGVASDGYWKVFRSVDYGAYISWGDPDTLDDGPPWTWAADGTISEVSGSTDSWTLWEGIPSTTSGGVIQGGGKQWIYENQGYPGTYGVATWGRVNFHHFEQNDNQVIVNTDHEVIIGTLIDIYGDASVNYGWVARGVNGTRYYNGETFTEAMARAWTLYNAAPDLIDIGPSGHVYSRLDNGTIVSDGAIVNNSGGAPNWPSDKVVGVSGGSIIMSPEWAKASWLRGAVYYINESEWYLKGDAYVFGAYSGGAIPSVIASTNYSAQAPKLEPTTPYALEPSGSSSSWIATTIAAGTPPSGSPSGLTSGNTGSTDQNTGLTSD
jgi:hypothetical protein